MMCNAVQHGVQDNLPCKTRHSGNTVRNRRNTQCSTFNFSEKATRIIINLRAVAMAVHQEEGPVSSLPAGLRDHQPASQAHPAGEPPAGRTFSSRRCSSALPSADQLFFCARTFWCVCGNPEADSERRGPAREYRKVYQMCNVSKV